MSQGQGWAVALVIAAIICAPLIYVSAMAARLNDNCRALYGAESYGQGAVLGPAICVEIRSTWHYFARPEDR